jgi:hypothetical protein
VADQDLPAPGALSTTQLTHLDQRLRLLRQGDVITLGATNIVGRGPTPTVSEASPGTPVLPEQVWTLTLVSELGFYVVLSQDCDILRAADVEPCLLVCPLEAVPVADWEALRRGPYSPREFPFPETDTLALPAGTAPVANIRFVTSMDKAALLAPTFRHVPALRSAPLRERFAGWLGRRAARAPHPDELEENVLAAAGERVRALARQFRQKLAKGGLSPMQMLVGAAEEWFLGPGEQLVPLQLVITPSSAARAGLWDDANADFRTQLIEKARASLAADLSKRAAPGLGYVVTVEVHTLDRVPALIYRTWSEWTWDAEPAWNVGDLEDSPVV